MNSGEKNFFTAQLPRRLAMIAVQAVISCKICGKFSGKFLYDLQLFSVVFFPSGGGLKKCHLCQSNVVKKKCTARNSKSYNIHRYFHRKSCSMLSQHSPLRCGRLEVIFFRRSSSQFYHYLEGEVD